MNFFIRMILIILLPCSLLENIFAAGGDDCPQRLYDNKCTESHCTALIKSSDCNHTSFQRDQFKLDETFSLFESEAQKTGDYAQTEDLDPIIQKVQEIKIQYGATDKSNINHPAFDEANPSESDTVSLQKGDVAVCPLQNENWMRTKSVDHLLNVEIDHISIDDVLNHIQLPPGFPQSESEIKQKIPGNGIYIDEESGLGISVDISKNICIGYFKNGKIQGFGLGFCKKDEYLFIGNFLDGESHGWGRSYFTNGDRYEGNFDNGFWSGWGTYYFTNGDRYEGDFDNGFWSGWGTYYFTNGDKYEGNYVRGVRSGWGQYYFKSGNRYEGNYVRDVQSGWGKSYFTNGDRYEGNFDSGFWSGKGEYYFNNGEKHEGNYVRSLRSGWGKYDFTNGDRYEGNFVEDLRHGKGKVKHKNGKTETVFYFKDKRVSKREFNDLTDKPSWLSWFSCFS